MFFYFWLQYLVYESTHVYASLQMHASLAEVAAAKARMFVNKPDGSKSFWMLMRGFLSRKSNSFKSVELDSALLFLPIFESSY